MQSGVPVPGPVIGMVLLFTGLLIRRRLVAGGDKPELPAVLLPLLANWLIG